jgi:hypothetical protein
MSSKLNHEEFYRSDTQYKNKSVLNNKNKKNGFA